MVPTMKPAELQQKHLRDPEDVTLPGAKFDHLTGFIGTVIEDFDLTKATDADIETIKELLAKRGVLHFRGQQNMGWVRYGRHPPTEAISTTLTRTFLQFALSNSKKEQVEFCRRLGDPYIHKSVKVCSHYSRSKTFIFSRDSPLISLTGRRVPGTHETPHRCQLGPRIWCRSLALGHYL